MGTLPYALSNVVKGERDKREYLERVKGIEPSYAAWEATVLPLNYTRFGVRGHYNPLRAASKACFAICA